MNAEIEKPIWNSAIAKAHEKLIAAGWKEMGSGNLSNGTRASHWLRNSTTVMLLEHSGGVDLFIHDDNGTWGRFEAIIA